VNSGPEILTTAGPILREAVGSQHDNAQTWTVSSVTPTTGSQVTINTNPSDHRDPYLEVLWVQYAPVVVTTARSFGFVMG
jgi:hypothetical protein